MTFVPSITVRKLAIQLGKQQKDENPDFYNITFVSGLRFKSLLFLLTL